MTIKKSMMTALTVSALATSTPVLANSWQGETKDAWLDGKIETALMLNGELNNFEIDTDVKKGKVTLTGTVTNDIEKDLAEQITSNVEGVSSVDNQLKVDKAHRSSLEQTGNNFTRTWRDLTTTAGINMKFAANDDLSATAIDVDTKNGVVTLSGPVKNEAAEDLAVEIAKSFDNVEDVNNQLHIAKN